MKTMIFVILLLVVLSHSFDTTDTEGQALIAMKGAFDNAADWDDSLSYCSWGGVFCSEDNSFPKVVSLNLSNLNLGGEISPAIGNLKNLQAINLQGNQLSGRIPEEIVFCGSLVYLDLSNNNLSGEIPSLIGKLKKLETLKLENNDLTGPIPHLPKLKTIDLSGNHLTGSPQLPSPPRSPHHQSLNDFLSTPLIRAHPVWFGRSVHHINC